MTRRHYLQIIVGVLVFSALAVGVTLGLQRLFAPPTAPALLVPATPAAPEGTPHITATLYYTSPDGQGLVPVRREVPLADGPLAQGRQMLLTQLQAPPAPYMPAIPAGTTLRAFFITEKGDAFVDLSPEVASGQAGGSLGELLTVYALVNAVTANLPSVHRVQVLVDGAETDTLAGHVDLRRPLERDVTLVQDPTPH